MLGFFKKQRRGKLRTAPFPEAWLSVVERNMPLFRRLPAADQAELLGHVQVFLSEKHFEGCGGLELTDEIRVTIAAHACLLLLHRDTDYYPDLTSLLVYPSTYVVSDEEYVGDGIWQEGDAPLLGHTQLHLRVLVLAWDAAIQEARDPRDGDNLLLHEFAHQLDFEDGETDGTPLLETRGRYVAWARILGEQYGRLRAEAEAGIPTLLDPYGATHPAEFFAVATETFFERPRELRARQPSLYRELKTFYQQDPAQYA
jgi:hypothetical protein